MSALATSFSKISKPSGFVISSVTPRLLVLRYRNRPLVSGFDLSPGNGPRVRDRSPAPGRSILITSAPMSANSLLQYGAETISPTSTIFKLDNAPAINAPSQKINRYSGNTCLNGFTSTRANTPLVVYGSLFANASASASLSMSTTIRLPLPSVNGPAILTLPAVTSGRRFSRCAGRIPGRSLAPSGPSWPIITNNIESPYRELARPAAHPKPLPLQPSLTGALAPHLDPHLGAGAGPCPRKYETH